MKRAISVLAAIFLLSFFFLCCPTDGGNESVPPVEIATAAQLNDIRNNLGGNFILSADIDLSGYTNWEPLGIFMPASDAPEDMQNPLPSATFSGTFDGNGHTISNVTISRPFDISNPASQSMATGLFGCIRRTGSNPAVIRNLTVESVDVSAFMLVGGVVGLQYVNSTLENVSFAGDNEIQGVRGVGGIVGISFGDMKNCTAIADIVISDAFPDSGSAGIVVGGKEAGVLKGCKVTGGSVSAEGDDFIGLGGLCGIAYALSDVTNCTTQNVTITVSGTGNRVIGGLIGFLGDYKADGPPTRVTNCTVQDVSITVTDDTARVGGLAGGSSFGFYENANRQTLFTIDNCSTSGTITGGATDSVGSIAGCAYAESRVDNNCTSTMTWSRGTLNKVGLSIAYNSAHD
ncbi:hypothetical protein LQZ19_02455 [Treponema primitia]|uniref:hypothetical protein n=1 Tax=Treponema primitia TaxID=88058 RepID=UPI003980D80F